MNRTWTAKWIGPDKESDFYPVLFKDFSIDFPIKKATLYISSIGAFEAYINGAKVGNEYLTPYINSEDGEVQYFEFDVTQLLYCGEDAESNSIDVFLGQGFSKEEVFALKAEIIAVKDESFEEEYLRMDFDELSSDEFDIESELDDLMDLNEINPQTVRNSRNKTGRRNVTQVNLRQPQPKPQRPQAQQLQQAQRAQQPQQTRGNRRVVSVFGADESKAQAGKRAAFVAENENIVKDIEASVQLGLAGFIKDELGETANLNVDELGGATGFDAEGMEPTDFTDGFPRDNVSVDRSMDYYDQQDDYFERKRKRLQSLEAAKVDAKEFGDFSKSNNMSNKNHVSYPEQNFDDEVYEEAELFEEDVEKYEEAGTYEEAEAFDEDEFEEDVEKYVEAGAYEEAEAYDEDDVYEEDSIEDFIIPDEEDAEFEEDSSDEYIPIDSFDNFVKENGWNSQEEKFQLEDIIQPEVEKEFSWENLPGFKETVEEVTEETEYTEEDIDALFGENDLIGGTAELAAIAATVSEIKHLEEAEVLVEEEEPEEGILVVCTDETWGYYASDIEESDINGLEVFNRILWEEKENPDMAAEVLDLDVDLVKRFTTPFVVSDTLPVVETKQEDDAFILDFGRSFTGFISFLSNQEHGARILVELGDTEDVFDKGKFEYVSDGVEELVCPHFAVYEGRYAKVTGWAGEFNAENFTANEIMQEKTQTGFIETSEAFLNTAVADFYNDQNNVSIKDLILADEKKVWVESMSINAKSVLYMTDAKDTYVKFLEKLRKAQDEMDGAVPEYVPRDEDAMEYIGDAVAAIPWNVYMMTGDKQILTDNIGMMEDWLRYVEKEKIQNNLFVSDTDEYTFIFTAAYVSALRLTGKALLAVGKKDDGKHFIELSEIVKEDLMDEFFTKSGRFALDGLDCITAALKYGVYDDEERLINKLVETLKNDTFELDAPNELAVDIATILAEHGKTDLAYRLIMDGKSENTCEFMFEQMAGIKPLEAGFKRFVIEPKFNARVIYENCSVQVGNKEIVSDWEVLDNGKIRMHLEVPHGMKAKLLLGDWDDDDMSVQEISAGSYYYEFKPEKDYMHIFNEDSIIRDVISYQESFAILEEINPEAAKAISEADEYLLCEPLDFIPLTEEEMKEFKERIFELQ